MSQRAEVAIVRRANRADEAATAPAAPLRTEPADPDPRLVLWSQPASRRAAAFRLIAQAIEADGALQVVAVSSARAGDGKTICAANLALALAESGQSRVLLIEAPTCPPQIARLFGVGGLWCFDGLFAAPRDPWTVVELAPLDLHLALANPRMERGPLVDREGFALAMSQLRELEYRYIIVDTPPVLGTAEANLIASASDGVVLAVRRGRSRARDVEAAIVQLGRRKVIGTALLES